MHSNDLTFFGKQLLSVLVTHRRNWIRAMKNWQKSSKLGLTNLKVDKELVHKDFVKKVSAEIIKYKKKVEQAGSPDAPHRPPPDDLDYIGDDLSTNQLKYIELTLCMLQHTQFPWMEKNAFSRPSTFINQTAALYQSQADRRLLLTTTQAWNMRVTLDTLLTEHHGLEEWSWWDGFNTQPTTTAEKRPDLKERVLRQADETLGNYALRVDLAQNVRQICDDAMKKVHDAVMTEYVGYLNKDKLPSMPVVQAMHGLINVSSISMNA